MGPGLTECPCIRGQGARLIADHFRGCVIWSADLYHPTTPLIEGDCIVTSCQVGGGERYPLKGAFLLQQSEYLTSAVDFSLPEDRSVASPKSASSAISPIKFTPSHRITIHITSADRFFLPLSDSRTLTGLMSLCAILQEWMYAIARPIYHIDIYIGGHGELKQHEGAKGLTWPIHFRTWVSGIGVPDFSAKDIVLPRSPPPQ